MAKDKVSVPSIQIGLNDPGLAYGGVIYSSTATVGYNGSATQLSINVALDTDTSSTYGNANPRDFSITKNDLDLTSPTEIKFAKVPFFKNMFLSSYEISQEVEDKVLSLTYSDGSVLLDRVFVGLIHEHFEVDPNKHGVLNLVELNIKCPKKVEQNPKISSYANADLANPDKKDGVYEVCSATETVTGLRKTYRKLANSTGDPRANYKTLRQDEGNIWAGGYIVLGKEEFSESKCAVRDVSYSFSELISAIRSFGISVNLSRFPNRKNIDQLTKNYSGTVRDVMQNWGNDLGITFYWDFSRTKPTMAIVNLADRSIQDKFENTIAGIDGLDRGHGSDLISGSDIIINSKQHTVDLNGTYSQAFSSNLTRGPSAQEKQKTFSSPVIFACQTLNVISETARSSDGSPTGNQLISGRTLEDYFVSMCLNKYAKSVRDPFLARKAIAASGISAVNEDGYFKALGFREIVPLTFGNSSGDNKVKQVLNHIQGSLGLTQMLTKTLQSIDIHYGDDYEPEFHVFLAVYDENLKNTSMEIESSVADNFLGKHYTLSAPAAEYFDCNPNYKILETLKTTPSSEFYGQSQHYKTPMAKFLESIDELRIDGLVTDGTLYQNQLFDDTNKLIEDFKKKCEEDNPFFNDDRENGFFHFERNAPWFANQRDIDNLLNPYRLATNNPDASGMKYGYVEDTILNRVRADIMAPYQPFMYDVPLETAPAVRRLLEGQGAIELQSTGPRKQLLKMLTVLDQNMMQGNKVKVVVCMMGDRSSPKNTSAYSIGDITITAPALRRNTIEEINALQSLCDRTNKTLKKDTEECKTLCENDFIEEMCSSEILGQGKLNCADLENIRDSAFSAEIEPDKKTDTIKGWSISLTRTNVNKVNLSNDAGDGVVTTGLPGPLYSDVKQGAVDSSTHFIIGPSQYGHKGILRYERNLTITDFGQRKVFDGLHKTKPIIKPTVSSVRYQTQDITQDIVSIYNPDNRQGIVEGQIPVDVLAQITGEISNDEDNEYLKLQSITASNYHDLLKTNISAQQVTTPRESVNYKIYLDESSGLSDLIGYLKQENGLDGMSIMADAGGYYLNVQFSNRPPMNPSLDVLFRMVKPQAKAAQPKMSFYRSM